MPTAAVALPQVTATAPPPPSQLTASVSLPTVGVTVATAKRSAPVGLPPVAVTAPRRVASVTLPQVTVTGAQTAIATVPAGQFHFNDAGQWVPFIVCHFGDDGVWRNLADGQTVRGAG